MSTAKGDDSLRAIDFGQGCAGGIKGFGLSHASLQSFSWARGIVASRALNIRSVKYLVPLADMFNYAPQPASSLRKRDSGSHFLQYHLIEGDSFVIKADRPCAAGQQLFEDYGDEDSSIYLQYHGFVASENPFDCVQLSLPALKGRAATIAATLGLRNTTMGTVCLRSPGIISPSCDDAAASSSGNADDVIDGVASTSSHPSSCVDTRHRWWVSLSQMGGYELARCGEEVKRHKGELSGLVRAARGMLRTLPRPVWEACPGLVNKATPASERVGGGGGGPSTAADATAYAASAQSSSSSVEEALLLAQSAKLSDERMSSHFARQLSRYPTTLVEDDRLAAAYDEEHNPAVMTSSSSSSSAHAAARRSTTVGGGGVATSLAEQARQLSPAGRTALGYRITRKRILAALVQHYRERSDEHDVSGSSSQARMLQAGDGG